MLDTVIIFQSFKTNLKISTSNVSFFTRLLCIFAIFNIIILNLAKRTSFSNICANVLIQRRNLRLSLPKPTMFCLLFAFWLLGLSITGFVIKIVFTVILGQIFITFIIYFILKLYIFINVFIQKFFLGMSCIYSLGFYRYLLFCVFRHYTVVMYFY